jgi:hypothetical protein
VKLPNLVRPLGAPQSRPTSQRATDFPADALGAWPVAREGDAPKGAARDEL